MEKINLKRIDTHIESLGAAKYETPLKDFVCTKDSKRVLYNVFEDELQDMVEKGEELISFERAGPRKKLYFKPKDTRAAIVSCGGLCPGINNVVRSIVMQLHYSYKIKEILGIRYGYDGLNKSKQQEKPIVLTPNLVKNLHAFGGSWLGSSRGYQPIDDMVNYLKELKVDILFTIGGDGTLTGALEISKEIKRQKLKISVIGIPKTIDNDIAYISKSFGFETAFSYATQSIESAHAEAIGAPNGIGLVKLMGRHSGFIAANATLALKEVNYVLIPEIDFDLDGAHGLLNTLKKRLDEKRHALIVVAEGSGQKFFLDTVKSFDASGNVKLNDIGLYIKDRIKAYFEGIKYTINLKYIDPSYIIRSLPANPNDSVFCGLLAQNAVHAGMAGKTKLLVGTWNNLFVHIPLKLASSKRKQIQKHGLLWQNVISSTGQPSFLSK